MINLMRACGARPNRPRLSAVLFCLAFLGLPAAGENARHVAAVSDLGAQGVEISSAQIISDRVRNEFVKTGAFTMVEREQMQAILKEQGFQQSGACSNEACLVEMGQLLGVDYMITGSVGKLGRTYTMSLRLIDVKSGKITATANADCKCEIDELLSTSAKQIVHDLLGELNRNASATGSASQAAAPSPGGKAAAGPAESQPAAKNQASPQPKKRLGWRIGLGAGGVVALGAALVFDQSVKTYAGKAETSQQAYLSSTTNAAYASYAADYKTNRDAANQSATFRNVSYAVAGLCAAGLVLTFVF